MDKITIKDIAKLCGVSVSTVSRAMNNHPDISKETKQKINKVIKDNHYVPNNNARNLKRTNSNTIAVLIKGITNPFFSGIIKIFEEKIKEKKYSLILQHVEDKEDEIEVAMNMVKEKKLKGIIFLGGHFSYSNERLNQIKVPYVLSTIRNMQNFNKAMCSSVSIDDLEESYKIVDYLCKLGHKKIAIITSAEKESIGTLRLKGYKKALKANGLKVNERLIRYMQDDIESYTMKNGYAVTKKLLKDKMDFTAIYGISDMIAIGACKAIFDNGRRIPEDYSVVGFDGVDVAKFYNPSITTIRQPVQIMAKETIKILFASIENKNKVQHRIFKGELIKGQSTKYLS